jgi:hypothetical protein
VAGTRNGLTLRIVDLRLEHDVDDESRHIRTVRERLPGLWLGIPSRGAVTWP